MPIPHTTANLMLNAFLGSGNLWIGLFRSMPTVNGGHGGEISAASYRRQPIVFNAPINSMATNNATINFPQATENWGTVIGFGLFDAEIGGNLKWFGQFPSESNLSEGSFFFVNAGGITIGVGL